MKKKKKVIIGYHEIRHCISSKLVSSKSHYISGKYSEYRDFVVALSGFIERKTSPTQRGVISGE